MTRSESIATLTKALAIVQATMSGATKGSTNPHFKSKYADLASVWDACRSALTANGFAVLQPVSATGAEVTVTTILSHVSGEWVASDLTMTAQQNTPQAMGSCITYARRYGLQSMVGIAPEDDDGNAASQPGKTAAPVAEPVPAGFESWLLDLHAVAQNGAEALRAAWAASSLEYRRHLTTTDAALWQRLKTKAEAVTA